MTSIRVRSAQCLRCGIEDVPRPLGETAAHAATAHAEGCEPTDAPVITMDDDIDRLGRRCCNQRRNRTAIEDEGASRQSAPASAWATAPATLSEALISGHGKVVARYDLLREIGHAGPRS